MQNLIEIFEMEEDSVARAYLHPVKPVLTWKLFVMPGNESYF